MRFYLEPGGKEFAKRVILSWLNETGGSNAKLLETVTGLPPKILHPLLAELMLEKTIGLDKATFKPLGGV